MRSSAPYFESMAKSGSMGCAARSARTWRIITPLALLLFSIGCQEGIGTSGSSAGDATDEKVARSTVERGPVKLTVQVEPKHARLSDEPTLTLTIDSEQGVKIQKPPFGESLGDMIIRDFREPLPETKGKREIVRQIYTLEPTRTGKISIEPISVTFTDSRSGGDGQEHTIASEPVEIEVTTIIGSDSPSLEQLKPAAAPVELPGSGVAWSWWIAGGVVLALVVAVLVWRRWRRPKLPLEKLLSPYELAYLEFEKLLESKWAETDVKLFYVELTAIVRRYIERTTGVHAPEQTTEEFLREIAQHEKFSLDERNKLQQFLLAADLVKFAGHQPNKSDIEDSFRRAKVFIGMEGKEQESGGVAA